VDGDPDKRKQIVPSVSSSFTEKDLEVIKKEVRTSKIAILSPLCGEYPSALLPPLAGLFPVIVLDVQGYTRNLTADKGITQLDWKFSFSLFFILLFILILILNLN
jgi:hypothetical protein